MANYLLELDQNACQGHAGCLTGLWFLLKPAQVLNTTATNNNYVIMVSD
jgi:hypothetical protein